MTHTMRGSIDGLRAAMCGPVIGPVTRNSTRRAGCGTPISTGARR